MLKTSFSLTAFVLSATSLFAQGSDFAEVTPDPGDTAASATAAGFGQVYGRLKNTLEDNDFFSVSISTAPTTITVRTSPRGVVLAPFGVNAAPSEATVDTFVEIFDTDGLTVIGQNNFDPNDPNGSFYSRLTVDIPSNGTYYVNINPTIDPFAGTFAKGNYSFDLFEQSSGGDDCGGTYAPVGENEPNDSCPSSDITFGCAEHTATLQTSGDSDFFQLTLAGPKTVLFEANASTATTGTSIDDTALWLYDSGCVEIAMDDDGGPGLFSALQVDLTAGTYYIEISDWQRAGAGDYTLTVTTATTGTRGQQTSTELQATCPAFANLPEVEPNDACPSTDVTAPCSEHTNTLQSDSDVDIFCFTLATTQQVTFETSLDTSTTGTARTDTRLWLYDAACNEIATDDDGGAGLFSLLQTTLTAGTYYIEVADWQRSGSGDYRLTFDSAGVCASPTSGVPMRLVPRENESPRQQTRATADISGYLSGSVAHVGFGAGGVLGLPIDLGIIGFPGCQFGVNPNVVIATKSTFGAPNTAAGQGEISYPVGNLPPGVDIHVQVLAIDPAFTVIASDNRLTWTTGDSSFLANPGI